MPVIMVEMRIAAPVERVFDLCRSIELHELSAADTGEKAVAGRTSGLIGPGEMVTWSARHLGVRQTLTSRITIFRRPERFRDSQVRGAFSRFDHDHYFLPDETAPDGKGGTIMRDVFNYTAPLGPLGRLADRLFLERHMRRFLTGRCEAIRRVAESDEWRRFVPPPEPGD